MKDLFPFLAGPVIEFVIIYAITGDVLKTILIMGFMSVLGLLIWMLFKMIGGTIE